MSGVASITLTLPQQAKATLNRQAAARGYSTSVWAGLVFDMGFAAVCARDKGEPASAADLDAIVGATLLLREGEKWDTKRIAAGLGVSEATVARILDGWRTYRRGG